MNSNSWLKAQVLSYVNMIATRFSSTEDEVMDNEKIQPTEHPHVVKILGASGIWQAAIKGTYIRVWALIGCHKRGMDEWEILKGFPTITAAQLHDALSFYHDHKNEIDDFIEANERAYDEYWADSNR